MYESEQRPPFARPLGRGELIAFDALVAALYAVVLAVLLVADALGSPAPFWLRCLIAAGMSVPLAVRRLWPRPVFGVVFAASVAALVLGVVNDSFVAAAFALYLVALTSPRRDRQRISASAVGVLSAAGFLLATVTGTPAPQARTIGSVVLGAALLGGAWTLGHSVRDRRAYAARSAAQQARQAVTDERLRIARELHDIVAHSMGVIAVKAAVANHVADSHPQETRDALRVIESASRNALAELRQMLGILRSDEPVGPQLTPDATGLADLADRAAEAGVHVELDVRGVERLPEGLRLSVFRIVQEALTNVLKHAAPARAQVTVLAGRHEVAIDVVDDGPGQRPLGRQPHGHQPAGHGLIGMRERVAAYGGSLTAEPRTGGGFSVSARMPYVASEEPTT